MSHFPLDVYSEEGRSKATPLMGYHSWRNPWENQNGQAAPLLHGWGFSCILTDGDPPFCADARFQTALVVSHL